MFRVYYVKPGGAIARGEWISAVDPAAAAEKAIQGCDGTTPTIEVWHRGERLAVGPCPRCSGAFPGIGSD